MSANADVTTLEMLSEIMGVPLGTAPVHEPVVHEPVDFVTHDVRNQRWNVDRVVSSSGPPYVIMDVTCSRCGRNLSACAPDTQGDDGGKIASAKLREKIQEECQVPQYSGEQQRRNVRKAIYALRHGKYRRRVTGLRTLRSVVKGEYVGREWVLTPPDDQVHWNALGVLVDVAILSGQDVPVRMSENGTWQEAPDTFAALVGFYGLRAKSMESLYSWESSSHYSWDFDMVAYAMEWFMRHPNRSLLLLIQDEFLDNMFKFAP